MPADLIFPTDIPSKANPTTSDILLIADVADSSELKKITIGDITQDIGSGLIVDGSSSLTTTYSSTKIAADNATQDAALTAGLALKVSKAGDTMTGQLKLAKGADIASATTTDLGAATGNYVDVTGTTTITGLGTVTAGTTVTVRFTGILTLTYNATSLILPTGASITTAAGDVATFTSLGSGNWRCTSYTRANGTPLVAGTPAYATTTSDGVVQLLTDAEAEAGTDATQVLVGTQNGKYSTNTLLRNDWYTYPVPIVATTTSALAGWTLTTGTVTVGGAGGYSRFTGATSVVASTSIPGNGSTDGYSPAQSKDIRVKFRVKFADLFDRKGFGLCITPANIFTAETDVTNGEVRFIFNDSGSPRLFAQNANGTTATSTNITGSLTLTNWNTFEIIFNPGTDIKFYANGTLVATHTTNLPTTGTQVLAYGVAGGNRTIDTFPPIISLEL